MSTIGAALDPRVRGQLRSVLLAAAAILAVVFTLRWFGTLDGSNSAFLIGLASLVLLPLVGLVGVGVMMIYAAEGRRIERDSAVSLPQRRLALWFPIIIGVALIGFAPMVSWAAVWGRQQVLLMALEPSFARMIAADAAAQRTPTIRYGDRALTMDVERTEPKRYFFELDGLADNSTGFIYDPTDSVLAARGYDADHHLTAPPAIREWFGGDIVACRRVRGHYHYCGLT